MCVCVCVLCHGAWRGVAAVVSPRYTMMVPITVWGPWPGPRAGPLPSADLLVDLARRLLARLNPPPSPAGSV